MHGRPMVGPRIVTGVLNLKHKETLNDGRMVEAIEENVYHQCSLDFDSLSIQSFLFLCSDVSSSAMRARRLD